MIRVPVSDFDYHYCHEEWCRYLNTKRAVLAIELLSLLNGLV